MFREGQAPRPTKSEWDSAVLEGVVRCEGIGIDRSTTIKTTKALTSPHSWLGLTEQQNLTLFRGRAWMPEVERPKALSTDAYKWSQKVGAGRTDRKRPRLHGRKANKAFI